MLNFRSYFVPVCLVPMVIFHCVDGGLFLCEEDAGSIVQEHTCTLQDYNCSKTIAFSMTYPDWEYYYKPMDYIFYLTFKYSIIVYIPHGLFEYLPNVRSLDLSSCNLSELSRYDFINGAKLSRINLSNNNLTALPDSSFNGAANLTEINLTHNRISHINANALSSLPNLTSINLSFNQIVQIPDNLFANLNNIRDIDLSQNSLSAFGSWFGSASLFIINNLNLNFNRISNISLTQNVWINELTVNNNELRVILLDRVNCVKKLHANNNKLQSNGIFISDYNLTELSLRNNSLVDFNFVQNLSNLVDLDLSFNIGAGQSIARNLFAKLSNLKYLQLESVSLGQIDFQLFSYLIQLKELDISNNDLKSVNFHMLSMLDKLERLYINGNSLTNITLSEFEFLFPNLIEMDISDNDWQCDRLVEILQKLRQINVKTVINPKQLGLNVRNIRGIRCYDNVSDWSHVTKIPIVRIHHNDEIVTKSTELNQTKSRLSTLQQQYEDLKMEFAVLLKELKSNRTGMGTAGTTRNNAQIQNLQMQIDTLKMKMSESKTETEKLSLPRHDNILNDDRIYSFAGDVKFIKIILVLFLIAGICKVGFKCYHTYFKRRTYSMARFHPSSDTITTHIGEDNF